MNITLYSKHYHYNLKYIMGKFHDGSITKRKNCFKKCSNAAIDLYKKYGFIESAFDESIYKRTNIKMELKIKQE
jgi:hypothetical protein